MKRKLGMFTTEAIRALLMSVIAGLSTIIGALIIFYVKNKNGKMLAISLGFAAGVMLSVSLADLFPNAHQLIAAEVGKLLGTLISVLAMVVGIVIAALLDMLVPHEEFDDETGDKPHKNLLRVGFVSMLAIALHNFPEGIATFMASYRDITLGLAIVVAISLHNIPEGISIAAPIYFATGSKKKTLKYTFLAGIAEPIGGIIAFLVLQPFMNDIILGIMFSLVSGIMIYIAVEELIPSSRQYGFDRSALIATLSGIILMPLTFIF
jgi:ZIP family zinc transporter